MDVPKPPSLLKLVFSYKVKIKISGVYYSTILLFYKDLSNTYKQCPQCLIPNYLFSSLPFEQIPIHSLA